jgi:membrane protein
MRAPNIIYDVPEGRCGLEGRTDPAGRHPGNDDLARGGVRHRGRDRRPGAESRERARPRPAAVTIWDIAKWPVLLIIIGLTLAILFWATPNARHGFQWVSPGGFIAVVLLLAASALFAAYVANFSHRKSPTSATTTRATAASPASSSS